MADVILYFATNADTMIATKALKDAGVVSKMIPKPASIQATANLCVTVDSGAEISARGILTAAGVALGGVAK